MIGWRPIAATAALAAVMAAGAPGVASAAPVEFDQITPPSRFGGSWSARLAAPARAMSRPRGGRLVTRLSTATSWSHHPQSLLVLDTHEFRGRQWLKVLLPIRPNGSTGWVRRNRVVLRPSDLWIEVRKRNRWLIAFRKGRKVRRFRIVIGRQGTPTPAGLAAVYERNRQPDPRDFLGPWSLPLTSLSPTLKNYGGGPGRIAMHGRGGASYRDPLGSASSHGCIRVPNRGIRWLAQHAGPGTPVRILVGEHRNERVRSVR